jgi:hypothetical protein
MERVLVLPTPDTKRRHSTGGEHTIGLRNHSLSIRHCVQAKVGNISVVLSVSKWQLLIIRLLNSDVFHRQGAFAKLRQH